jgi:hypothetical protein
MAKLLILFVGEMDRHGDAPFCVGEDGSIIAHLGENVHTKSPNIRERIYRLKKA